MQFLRNFVMSNHSSVFVDWLCRIVENSKAAMFAVAVIAISIGSSNNAHASFNHPLNITNPAPNSVLTDTCVRFTGQTSSSFNKHWLWIGTTKGADDISNKFMGYNDSENICGLRESGTIYVRYVSLDDSNNILKFTDHVYTMDVNKFEIGAPCGYDPYVGQLVYDCSLNCVAESTVWNWVGDGYCDEDEYDINLNCPEFNFDGTDCITHYPREVIIDNGKHGTYSTGNWKVSERPNSYGHNSLYHRDNGDAKYTWDANGQMGAGWIDIYVWWTSGSNRCDVEYEIFDGYSWKAVVGPKNQRINGGQWNYLGSWNFHNSPKVVLTSKGHFSTGVDCSTSADAVRFVLD